MSVELLEFRRYVGTSVSPIFTAVNLGDIAADRHIVVAAGTWGVPGNRAVSSVTIGGAATTLCVATPTGGACAAIFISSAPVASGESADITVNFSGAPYTGAWIAVWRVTNLASITPFDTDSAGSAAALSQTISLDIPVRGFAVAGSTSLNGAISQRYGSAAFDDFPAGEVGRSITANHSGGVVWTGLTKISDADLSVAGGASWMYLCGASFAFSSDYNFGFVAG